MEAGMTSPDNLLRDSSGDGWLMSLSKGRMCLLLHKLGTAPD